jgi:hypothetical protein
MADRISQAGPSTWYWYQLDPADFAVQAGASEDTGVSLIWKGGVEVNRLGECFKSCARKIGFQAESDYRVWMMMPDGSRHFDIVAEDIPSIPPELINQMSYIRFELWPVGTRPSIEEAGRKPVFAMWSNLDENAERLDELQQCVGIRVLPDHLFPIEEELSGVVNEISSRYFPPGSYKREAVLERLQRVRSELPALAEPV